MVLEAPDMAQKILIVDDEQEVLSMLRRCFLLEGYEVITAAGGQEALQKLTGKPDIILWTDSHSAKTYGTLWQFPLFMRSRIFRFKNKPKRL